MAPHDPFNPESGTRQNFEVGDTISNITFVEGENGRYINNKIGTKIIMLDRNTPPMMLQMIAQGASVDVKVTGENKKNARRNGTWFVTVEQLAKMPGDPEAGVQPKGPEPIEVDHEKGIVYVLDTALPLNTETDPVTAEYARSRFEGSYTIDKRTAETIHTVADAVAMRQPCLLEGETAVSKTSAIEYLAAMSGNETVRLNLNGQTDTSELIGKFVPNDEGAAVQFAELMHNKHALSEASQAILNKVAEEGRGLSQIETQKIADQEGLQVADWTWKDGLVVQAMKQGKWLILDEMNLAEAQILERLNSVLEQGGSLTLSENGGLVVRTLSDEEMAQYERGDLKDVAPKHPNFRIFGTMNPAEYQGRSVMSPAYKDRWPVYHFVQRPTEQDYQAMLKHLVYGIAPEFVYEAEVYGGGQGDSRFPKLESAEAFPFTEVIPALAKFHTRMEDMAREKEIGKNRREPYIFTRRGLLDCLRYLEEKRFHSRGSGEETSYNDDPQRIFNAAIERYYLNKMVSEDDRNRAQDTLDAIGLDFSKVRKAPAAAKPRFGGARPGDFQPV